jgi:hypothetical protein
LLGAVALESLLLVVDPVGKRLIPTNALAMSTSRDTVAIPAELLARDAVFRLAVVY